jgi:hypothetical protein
MSGEPLDSAADIEKICRNLLKQSKSWGVFPTPVEKIVAYANLTIEAGIDLSKVDPGFLSRFEFVPKWAKKVLGMLDYRQKVIYLDHTQQPQKKGFVTVHEVFHEILPWQEALGFMDDEQSLAPEVKEKFEREASFGASAALFQLELFDEQAEKLPLSIKSPLVIAQKAGASNHSAIRRFVERSPKRCALLVLHPPELNGKFRVRVRDYFQSATFAAEFGELKWPEVCGWNLPFVPDIKFKRRLHENGKLEGTTESGESIELAYHFFNNGFNSFIMLLPLGEKNKSRIVILEKDRAARAS